MVCAQRLWVLEAPVVALNTEVVLGYLEALVEAVVEMVDLVELAHFV